MTDNLEYRLRRRTRRKTGFPLASLLFYGPDETRASKAVLAVLPDERTEEISALRRWFSDEGDIRADQTVLAEIIDMLALEVSTSTVCRSVLTPPGPGGHPSVGGS